MLNRLVSFVSITGIAIVVLAACGSDGGGEVEDVTRVTVPGAPVALATPGASPAASPGASPAASPAVADGGGGEAGGGTAFTIDMLDIKYVPTEVTVPADTEVTINLPNKGVTVHNFLIDPLEVKSADAAGGTTTSVTFEAAAGEYKYYCSQPGHEAAGMFGTLVVE